MALPLYGICSFVHGPALSDYSASQLVRKKERERGGEGEVLRCVPELEVVELPLVVL